MYTYFQGDGSWHHAALKLYVGMILKFRDVPQNWEIYTAQMFINPRRAQSLHTRGLQYSVCVSV